MSDPSSLSYFLPAFLGVIVGAVVVSGSVQDFRKKGPIARVLGFALFLGIAEVGLRASMEASRPLWVQGVFVFGSITIIAVIITMAFIRKA